MVCLPLQFDCQAGLGQLSGLVPHLPFMQADERDGDDTQTVMSQYEITLTALATLWQNVHGAICAANYVKDIV